MCVSGDKSGPALPTLTGPGQETRVWPAEEGSAATAPRGRRPSGPAPPLPSSRCRTGRLQPLLLISLRLQPGKATPARLRSSPAISSSVPCSAPIAASRSPCPAKLLSSPGTSRPQCRARPTPQRLSRCQRRAALLAAGIAPAPREDVSCPPALPHRLLSSPLSFPSLSAKNLPTDFSSRPLGTAMLPLRFFPVNKPSLTLSLTWIHLHP